MAVPARPVGGASIESAWGQVVHDTAVAQDIQHGVASIVIAASTQGSLVVTFPRPFAAAPDVTAMIGPQGAGALLGWTVQLAALSATAMTLRLSGSTSQSATLPVPWIAIGPRA